jgi:multidrug efflux pump subunit AcrB
MAEIGETINSAIGGQRIGKFKDKGRRFDIRVRLLAQQRQRPEDIGRLLVRAGGGGLVRLGDIVRIEQRPTLQTITRRDRERAITLRANVAPGVSQSVAIDRSVEIARETLPENYRAVPSGTAAPSASPSIPCCSRWGSGSWSPTWCWRRSSTPSPTPSPCCWRCPSA